METTVVRSHKLYVLPEDYLADELTREVRHEYVAGMLRPMPGSKVAHNRIVRNLVRRLDERLNGSPCEVFVNDIKVYIKSFDDSFYYYPDVIVDCSNADGSSLLAPEPKVVFEVLSESTEMVDRGEKRVNYCTLPSLQAYVLIWQTDPTLMIFRRRKEAWTRELIDGLEQTLLLPEIDCKLALRDIYKRVEFDA